VQTCSTRHDRDKSRMQESCKSGSVRGVQRKLHLYSTDFCHAATPNIAMVSRFCFSTMKFAVVLAGDYNVVPTDTDIYAVRSWRTNALLQPEPRAAYARLLAQAWTDAIRSQHPAAGNRFDTRDRCDQ
jgi:hypothetical protein